MFKDPIFRLCMKESEKRERKDETKVKGGRHHVKHD